LSGGEGDPGGDVGFVVEFGDDLVFVLVGVFGKLGVVSDINER